MYLHRCPFAVIQPGTAQFFIVQIETQGLDQMEAGSHIGAKTDDVASVWRYFWFVEQNVEHFMNVSIPLATGKQVPISKYRGYIH